MKDIKNTKEQDLIKTLNEKRTDLRNFRFGSTGSKTRNVKEGLGIRKEIAQILTEIRSRKA